VRKHHAETAQHWLLVMALFGYTIVSLFYIVSRFTVVQHRTRRKAKEESSLAIAKPDSVDETVSSQSAHGWAPVTGVSSAVCHKILKMPRFVKEWCEARHIWPFRKVICLAFGFGIFVDFMCKMDYCSLTKLTPFWLIAECMMILDAVNELCEGEIRGPKFHFRVVLALLGEIEMTSAAVCAIITALAIKRSYVASLLLLDMVSISVKMQNVTRAALEPAWDIAATFLLMVFVIFIFASFGFYMFGQLVVGEDELESATLNQTSGSIDVMKTTMMQCPDLLTCFIEVRKKWGFGWFQYCA
jgi:hypothetical protein